MLVGVEPGCYHSRVAMNAPTHPALILLRGGALVALAASVALGIEYYGPGDTFCQPGGGCAAVHASSVGQLIGDYLPLVGLFGFTTLFVLTLPRSTWTRRLMIYGSIVAGVGGLAFLVMQALLIGQFCYLCVIADTSAILCASAAIWILRTKVPEDRLGHGFLSPSWALFWPAVFGPVAWFFMAPPPEVPDAIRELYSPSAEVNVVEMADFECPYCRAMHPVLREAIERSGHDVHFARIVYPLAFHPFARNSARAYFCAVEQERGERMADALFTAADLSPPGNRASAEEVGLDMAAYDACIGAESTEARVVEDLARGDRAGMQGLPSVYIGEQTIVGFLPGSPPDEFVLAMDMEASGEGESIPWWPLAFIVILSTISLALSMFVRGLMARSRGRTKPATKETQAG
ncbi:MAG: thioredoxin domain-containing protein [Sandaracinaceae bacterium]